MLRLLNIGSLIQAALIVCFFVFLNNPEIVFFKNEFVQWGIFLFFLFFLIFYFKKANHEVDDDTYLGLYFFVLVVWFVIMGSFATNSGGIDYFDYPYH